MRRSMAAMFLVTLLALEGAACASASGQVRLGREGQSSAQGLRDQLLVQMYGESGALSRLLAEGVTEREARTRIDNALVAAHAAGKEQ